jgi:hypothetical protein
MFKRDVTPKQAMSVTLRVTMPVRLASTDTFRRAMETGDGQIGLGALLRRAWRLATSGEGRPSATRKDDLVTSLLSGLLVLGLFLDGWNHLNLQEGKLGPFLTPWHFGLYFGFTVTGLWILSRGQQRGSWNLARVPRGYGSALVGMGISTVAMAGDAAWHTMFGVETGVARVISPFHLVLFIGAVLLVTSSFRSACSARTPAKIHTLREFAPALLSITLAAAMIAFLFQFASPYVLWTSNSLVQLSAQSPFHETMLIYGLLAVLVTNLIMVTPVLMILRRWEPPFGTCTFLFGGVAVLSASMTNLAWAGPVAAAVAGGLIADLAIARLRPTPNRPAATRAVGAIIPAGLWGSHFAALHYGYGITWPVELWLGAIVLAAFAGIGLSLLTAPARVPNAARADADSPATAAYELISAAQQWEAERAALTSAAPAADDQTTLCHHCGPHDDIDDSDRTTTAQPAPLPTLDTRDDDAASTTGPNRNTDIIALMHRLLDLEFARTPQAAQTTTAE